MFLNIYMCFFGLIIMASSINMPCIARNFFFILTGKGKGIFNIFVGTLLFLNEPGKFSPSMVLGWMLVVSGLLFIFFSFFKKMSDEDLQRATSLYGAELQKKAMNSGKKFTVDHSDDIARAAVNNRDVIANVVETPMDRGDSVANAAYHDNKEF